MSVARVYSAGQTSYPMNSEPKYESEQTTQRRTRRYFWALGAVFIIILGTLFVANAVVAHRIRRITDLGGMVESWDYPPLFAVLPNPIVWWLEDVYVIRRQYDVYYGNRLDLGGCGTGITLTKYSKLDGDPGDDGLVVVGDLRGITRLFLRETSVSDEGLHYLGAIPSLEVLDLKKTQVLGPGLMHLQNSNLHSLTLTGTQIDDAALAYVSNIASLQHLNLNETRIRGPGLSHLQKLRSLTSLDLSGTRITDDGLRHLTALPIKTLYISNTTISDVGLEYIEQLPQLQHISMCHTRVTKDAATRSSSKVIRDWVPMSPLCELVPP
jgi:hypothetical protein